MTIKTLKKKKKKKKKAAHGHLKYPHRKYDIIEVFSLFKRDYVIKDATTVNRKVTSNKKKIKRPVCKEIYIFLAFSHCRLKKVYPEIYLCL